MFKWIQCGSVLFAASLLPGIAVANLECKENYTGIDCVKKVCNEIATESINNYDDYNSKKPQWYDISNKCSLDNTKKIIADFVDVGKPIYKVSIPEGPNGKKPYFMNVKLDKNKLMDNVAPIFVFALSETPEYKQTNKGISNQCSDFSISLYSISPVDDAAINKQLQENNTIPIYGGYNDAEFALNFSGILFVNYGDWPMYKNDPVKYTEWADAVDVFNNIKTALSGSACADYYLHLIGVKSIDLDSINDPVSWQSEKIPMKTTPEKIPVKTTQTTE